MRARFLRLGLLLLCAASPAFAQFDTVTGQVVDPNGLPYSGATVRAVLTLAGTNVTGQPTVTNSNQAQCISAGLGNAPCQMPFPGTQSFTLDPNGNIPGGGYQLANNPSITPAGTQWTFNVTISPGVPPPFGFGPQSFSVAITINSSPQAIGGTLSAAAPALTHSTAGTGTPCTLTNDTLQYNNSGAFGCVVLSNVDPSVNQLQSLTIAGHLGAGVLQVGQSNAGAGLGTISVYGSLGCSFTGLVGINLCELGTGASGQISWLNHAGSGNLLLGMDTSDNVFVSAPSVGETFKWNTQGWQDQLLITNPGPPAGGYNRLYMDSTTGLSTCLNSSGFSCNPAATGGVTSLNTVTLSSNVTVGTTATTITSLSVTFPSSGCPCRADIRYSLYYDGDSFTDETAAAVWVSDGTHTMAGLQTGDSNAVSGGRTSMSLAGFSTVTYANNAVVTFTLLGQYANASSFNIDAAPTVGAGPNSTFQIMVIQCGSSC